MKVQGYTPTSPPPECNLSEHRGRMYYDLNRNRMHICTSLNGDKATYTGWKDMHDNTPD